LLFLSVVFISNHPVLGHFCDKPVRPAFSIYFDIGLGQFSYFVIRENIFDLNGIGVSVSIDFDGRSSSLQKWYLHEFTNEAGKVLFAVAAAGAVKPIEGQLGRDDLVKQRLAAIIHFIEENDGFRYACRQVVLYFSLEVFFFKSIGRSGNEFIDVVCFYGHLEVAAVAHRLLSHRIVVAVAA
jgi:hypothetical protein